jgi:hypothetical protein
LHYWIWPPWPALGFLAHVEELFSLFVSLCTTFNWPQLFLLWLFPLPWTSSWVCTFFTSIPKTAMFNLLFFFSLQSFDVDSATAII